MTATDQRIRETFVELAATLVDDYDLVAFLDTLAKRVVELLETSACGIVLVDHHGTLNLVAASNEQTRLLELLQLQNHEGPCLDCYRQGSPVHTSDLAQAESTWPGFVREARSTGFQAVYALPMRLRDTVIGAMNIFSVQPAMLGPDAVALAQALADVATIGILHERTVYRYEHVAEQLQIALDSRILIEQAKGKVAEQLNVSVDEAFDVLRGHARSNNRKVRDVAAEIVEGDLRIPNPPSG